MKKKSYITRYRENQTKQLGMSPGKARNRLVNSLLFSFVQTTNQDTCYRCEKRIESVNDFSLDHIKNWRNSNDPINLFFDLNNISFSHKSCNYSAARKFSGKGKITLTCSNCNTTFQRLKSEYDHRKSKGCINFYCNRKCFVEHKNYSELSDDEVREIRWMAERGDSTRAIGKIFNKSHVSISHCINRTTYKHVK